MREAIGGTWLFQIVIVFILLFTGYLSLSVNYSKAFNVKNEIIKIIERHRGVNEESLIAINEYLTTVGYRTTGNCSRGDANLDYYWRGYSSRSASTVTQLNGNNVDYCIREIGVVSDHNPGGELPFNSYYQVKVFFRLDLPVFTDAFTFAVKGDTRLIYFPDNN